MGAWFRAASRLTEEEYATAHAFRIALDGVPDYHLVVGSQSLDPGASAFDPVVHGLCKGTSYHGADLIHLALALTQPGQTILDIGAHVGTFSLPLVSAARHAIAFEPAPFDCAYLRASVRHNEFGDALEVVHAAASDRAGSRRLIYTGRYAHLAPAHEPGGVEVPVVRVGDALADRPGSIGLVKLDVEGHEVEALAGMAEWLRSVGLPPLVYESNHHWLGWQSQTAKSLRLALAEIGYRHHYLLRDRRRLTPVALDDIQPEPTCDLLATPTPLRVPDGWSLTEPLSPNEFGALLETTIQCPWGDEIIGPILAQIGTALRAVDPSMNLQSPALDEILDRLADDARPVVREAFGWRRSGALARARAWVGKTILAAYRRVGGPVPRQRERAN